MHNSCRTSPAAQWRCAHEYFILIRHHQPFIESFNVPPTVYRIPAPYERGTPVLDVHRKRAIHFVHNSCRSSPSLTTAHEQELSCVALRLSIYLVHNSCRTSPAARMPEMSAPCTEEGCVIDVCWFEFGVDG